MNFTDLTDMDLNGCKFEIVPSEGKTGYSFTSTEVIVNPDNDNATIEVKTANCRTFIPQRDVLGPRRIAAGHCSPDMSFTLVATGDIAENKRRGDIAFSTNLGYCYITLK